MSYQYHLHEESLFGSSFLITSVTFVLAVLVAHEMKFTFATQDLIVFKTTDIELPCPYFIYAEKICEKIIREKINEEEKKLFCETELFPPPDFQEMGLSTGGLILH